MGDYGEDYEMEEFDNMDDMFPVDDDSDSIKDVFSEFGGWDKINIDVLIQKPVVWNFKQMMTNLKPIHWKFNKEMNSIKKLNWQFIDHIATIDFDPLNWGFIEQLAGMPTLIWPFKPQMITLKHGKWYFKCQLKDIDDSPVRWAFSRCLQSESSVIWGFESQLHDFHNLPWSFSTQICDTMRKHRAFVKQITVSTVRWNFKTQLVNMPPINWYFKPQLAQMIPLPWNFPHQLHDNCFEPITWNFPRQIDSIIAAPKNRKKRSVLPHLCENIEALPWIFQKNLDPAINYNTNKKHKKVLDSSIAQSSITWYFRNQISSIKQLNWKFEKLIKQETLKDISLEQVQSDKKQFQDQYLENYHKPAFEYRKAVHSKFRRPIEYKNDRLIS